MKMTVKVVLDVDVEAWQEIYPADGLREAHDRIDGYVRQLVATSPEAIHGLWRVIQTRAAGDHPPSCEPYPPSSEPQAIGSTGPGPTTTVLRW